MTAALQPAPDSGEHLSSAGGRYVLAEVGPCAPWCAGHHAGAVLAADAGCASEPFVLSVEGAELGVLAVRPVGGDVVVTVDVTDRLGRVAEVSMPLWAAEQFATQVFVASRLGGDAVRIPAQVGAADR